MSITFLNFFDQTHFDELDAYLLSKVFHPMLPRLLKVKALREAAMELCRESEFWRDELVLYPAEGLSQYLLPIDTGVQLVKLIGAVQEGKGALDLDRDCWVLNPAAVQLSDEMASSGLPITLTVSLMPSTSAETISTAVVQYCGDWIADGAAYRLKMMPGQPWTAPQEAMVHKQEFVEGMRKARRAVLNRFTTYRNPVRSHKFH